MGRHYARLLILLVLRQAVGDNPSEAAARVGVVLWSGYLGIIKAVGGHIDFVAKIGVLEGELCAAAGAAGPSALFGPLNRAGQPLTMRRSVSCTQHAIPGDECFRRRR